MVPFFGLKSPEVKAAFKHVATDLRSLSFPELLSSANEFMEDPHLECKVSGTYDSNNFSFSTYISRSL